MNSSKMASVADEPVVLREVWDMLGMKIQKNSPAMHDLLDAREYLRKHGMPYAAIVKISEVLGVNISKEVPDIFGISPKTMQRRKEKHRFEFGEAVNIFMVAELFKKATAVLGDPETAVQWFKEPNRALKGMKPIALLNDDMGRKLVEELLGRIEHGIYG